MSQTEQPLDVFFIDIVGPAHTECTFRCLAELTDLAFTLASQQADLDPASVPLSVTTRRASILYPVGNTEAEPSPLKAVLHQSAPAMEVRQVVIDFHTKTAECRGQPNLPIEPEQIECALEEIKSYLRDVWNVKKAREGARQLQVNLAWRDFLERLEYNDIFPADSCQDPDDSYTHRRCPLCETQTAPCTSCHAIMCLNRDCAASQLIPFRSCSHHISASVCLPCLESASGIPLLGECPDCNLWFCGYELMWCLGRPKDGLSWSLRHDLHSAPNSREHPIKPTGCFSCTGSQDRPHCSSGKCWSGASAYRSICESCSRGGGLWCACEHWWICDDCEASPTKNRFKGCPRCKRFFCVEECEYIQFCAECGRTTLCDDCIEEDWSPLLGPDAKEGVLLKEKCNSPHCMGKICGSCLEGTRCGGCSRTFCGSCMQLQRCDFCDGRFCPACYRTCERICGGCDVG